MFHNAAEENVISIRAYVTELKERVAIPKAVALSGSDRLSCTYNQFAVKKICCFTTKICFLVILLQVLELESNEGKANDMEEDSEENAGSLQDGPDSWDRLFKEQMQHIIQLWDLCHVSIIHRTQFYLLFRGDRADQIYIEVEVRRLTWLQQHFAEVGDASPAAGDDSTISLASR
jgi:centromeric protein E